MDGKNIMDESGMGGRIEECSKLGQSEIERKSCDSARTVSG